MQLVDYFGNTDDVTILGNKEEINIELKDAAHRLEADFLKRLLELEEDMLPVGKINNPLLLGMGKRITAYKQNIVVAQGISQKETDQVDFVKRSELDHLKKAQKPGTSTGNQSILTFITKNKGHKRQRSSYPGC